MILMGPPPQETAAAAKPRRLERRNAAKNIGYDASLFCSYPRSPPASTSASASASASFCTSAACSVDLTSFRIGGSGDGGGDVQILCRSLGLSGPDDFAIPLADWEAHKAVRSSSSNSSSPHPPSPPTPTPPANEPDEASALPAANGGTEGFRAPPSPPSMEPAPPAAFCREESASAAANLGLSVKKGGRDGGIKGARPPPVLALPPVLKPPPSMALPAVDAVGSTWDILRSFAPDVEECSGMGRSGGFDRQDEKGEEEKGGVVLELLMLGETSEDFTGTSSMSTTNDDETSSTTTETMFYISPNGRFKRKIRSWNRGMLLGSGSFGMVYEGISEEGVFFAVKEVCLHDQGINSQQCILQLEQEIALLSQFEHENIVQYYGTDKEDSKLYIFLELVTQGSLASLYQKYRLRDTHVSAYTRQVLKGLIYLHERNIVHRDIKCANILVHANGSVKLADFGLAKEISKLTELKSCKGTVYWMAPEVVNPKRTYGPAADIWSLGCTVLEMLTRQIPYPNLEWTQALFKIGKGEPPIIPNSLSRDARDFISQCLKLNPEERPSASKLLEHPFVNWSMRSMRSSSRLNSSRSTHR